jgi:hypothetical protein
MLVNRLYSFLEEWLVHVRKGENLYENRSTPLWDVVHDLLAKRPGPQVNADAVRLCLQVLEVQEKAPARLQLEHREDALRFLTCVILSYLGSAVNQHGSKIDLPRQILLLIVRLCQNLVGAAEPPVALYFLRKLKEAALRHDLKELLATVDLGGFSE